MADKNDPLADLRAEIAEENDAAEAGVTKNAKASGSEPDKKPAPVSDDDEPDTDDAGDDEPEDLDDTEDSDEESEDKDAKAKSAKDDKAPKKGDPEKGYKQRLTKSEAELRITRRALAEKELELETLRKDAKGEAPDIEKLRNEARQQARLEIQLESFVNSGYSDYGQKEFDEASKNLVDLGAPDNMVMIAVEATGSASLAAKAIWALSQEDPDFIEGVLKMPPLRMASALSRLANVRLRPSKARAAEEDLEEEDEQPPRRNGKAPGRKASMAPAPLKTVNGNRRTSDDISDDDSEEEFTNKFGKLMDRKFGTASH